MNVWVIISYYPNQQYMLAQLLHAVKCAVSLVQTIFMPHLVMK